jgi:hypothetical protein
VLDAGLGIGEAGIGFGVNGPGNWKLGLRSHGYGRVPSPFTSTYEDKPNEAIQ